jgi:hypothetical protein
MDQTMMTFLLLALATGKKGLDKKMLILTLALSGGLAPVAATAAPSTTAPIPAPATSTTSVNASVSPLLLVLLLGGGNLFGRDVDDDYDDLKAESRSGK